MLDFECGVSFFVVFNLMFVPTFYLYLICFSRNDINKHLPMRTKQANRRQHENMTCNKKGDNSFTCHSFFGWHPSWTVGSPVLMKPTSPKHFLSNFSSKLERQNSQQLKHHGKKTLWKSRKYGKLFGSQPTIWSEAVCSCHGLLRSTHPNSTWQMPNFCNAPHTWWFRKKRLKLDGPLSKFTGKPHQALEH